MKEVPPTMKKLSILLALLLALTTLGALAELATKAYEVTLGDFLGDTDLMAFRNEGFGMQGIVDASGNVLVPNEYYDLSLKNPWGYIVAAKLDQLNGKGVIDATGKVLIPFEYAEFEVLSKDWVIAITLEESTKENYDYQALFGGYGSGYYLIVDRTFFNMKTGQAVGKVARNDFDSVNVFDGFLIIEDMQGGKTVYDENFQPLGTARETYYPYDIVKNGEQWEVRRAGDGQLVLTSPVEISSWERSDGLLRTTAAGKAGRMDMQGNVLIPAEYENLMVGDDGYARAKLKRDEKMGLLDKAGKPLTEFKYDDIPPIYLRGISVGPDTVTFISGYAPVEVDGKIGFINEQGEETLAPTYAKDAVELNGNTLLFADATGKKTLVAADGVVTELPYKDVQRVYNGANGRLYAVTDEAGKTGVIDWHGNILVPLGDHPGYDIKSDTANTLVTVKNRDTGKLEVYKVPQV